MVTKAPTKKVVKAKESQKPVVKKREPLEVVATKKVMKKKVTIPAAAVAERYVYAVGRRKTAVAQVRLYPTKEATPAVINKRPIREYFGTEALEVVALAPLVASGLAETFMVSVVVRGGGLHGQAGAVSLGIARCLIKHDPLLRATLKALGFLTRDARMVERKKPGLKKARRSPQWAKR